eukprot:jgi/Psemu1/235144/estExt_Genewise1.C_240128
MVLPSLIRNVLEPNARHGCDVFAHVYMQESEPPGRRNPGGELRPRDIALLKDAVQSVAKAHYDALVRDHYQSFLERRAEQMREYREATTTTADGRTVPAYFPWEAKSYGKSSTSLDNIVKQWHSIQTAFKMMDYTAKVRKHSYDRVGMFRSDALYVTPIDIASLGNAGSTAGSANANANAGSEGIVPVYDVHNRYFVTPGFALNPINDRMVYGPYDAVKIWATKRFDLVEESATHQTNPGWTMHSERFLNHSLIPAMEELGYTHRSNGDICFLRTRADESAIIADCDIQGLVPTPRSSFWNDGPSEEAEQRKLSTVESIVGKSCRIRRLSDKKWRFVLCGKNQNDNKWGENAWL